MKYLANNEKKRRQMGDSIQILRPTSCTNMGERKVKITKYKGKMQIRNRKGKIMERRKIRKSKGRSREMEDTVSKKQYIMKYFNLREGKRDKN